MVSTCKDSSGRLNLQGKSVKGSNYLLLVLKAQPNYAIHEEMNSRINREI